MMVSGSKLNVMLIYHFDFFSYIKVYTSMYQVYTGVYQYILVYTSIYWCIPVYTSMCIGIYWYIPVCTMFVLVCTDLSQYIQLYSWFV